MSKFDFNQKKMSVFQKFVMFLNEITDEVKDIEPLADADKEDSGEVVLKYKLDDDKFIEVKPDGTVWGWDGVQLTDGEYPLEDGSILLVTDGKFNGTKNQEEATNNEGYVEPEIAQADEDGEKKEEEKTAEEPKEEEKKEEEVTQEGEELVPFEIGGVTYEIPSAVVDYINSLSATSETFRKEIVQIRQRIPSTKPTVTNPISQSKEEKVNLYDKVNLFRK